MILYKYPPIQLVLIRQQFLQPKEAYYLINYQTLLLIIITPQIQQTLTGSLMLANK